MAQCNTLNVNLCNTQLNTLISGIKDETEVNLIFLSSMINYIK